MDALMCQACHPKESQSALLPSPGRRIATDFSKSRMLAESLTGKRGNEKAIHGSQSCLPKEDKKISRYLYCKNHRAMERY